MVRKANECDVELRENMRGGDGTVELTNFVTKDELLNKCRLFELITLKPGCGIGYHVHENETEIFYIKNGTALYNDGGVEVTVNTGDVTVTPPGTGHSIKNVSDETTDVVALIINA